MTPAIPQSLRLLLSIVGLVIIVQCSLLIADDKINFGTVIPWHIGLIFILHGLYAQQISNWLSKHTLLKRLWKLLWYVFVIWLISFVIFIFNLKQNIDKNDNDYAPVKAIIVLGGGVVNDQPTPTLANRLDAAAPLIKMQPDAVVITSGGIGIGNRRSEAEVMANYLHDNYQIELNHILQEGRSTSTEENFLFSQPILKQQAVPLDAPIAVVTSDFHTIRSKAIAEHQGYENPLLVGSPTPLSIRYNAWFREYFAFVSGWLLNEY